MANPTPEALAKAAELIARWDFLHRDYPTLHFQLALVLTEQAREIERATWGRRRTVLSGQQ